MPSDSPRSLPRRAEPAHAHRAEPTHAHRAKPALAHRAEPTHAHRAKPALAGRAVLALALLVGFYVLALGLAAVLVWLSLALSYMPIKLVVLALVAAAVILWSIVPRIDRFEPPGPIFTPAKHPALFAEIADVAACTGQTPPKEVYAINAVNAFVTERGGMLGIGTRRVMGLGLPLLQGLTVAEFRAVLAHEFGHFHGGDTKLGPWIYRTRAALARTVTNLAESGNSIVHKPFAWYGNYFVRVTEGISREQELAADRLAAECVGAEALAGGLNKIARLAPAFDVYLRSEFFPVLEAKRRPPMLSGFRHFVAEPAIAAELERVADEQTKRKADPWDSHPPLGERIAALRSAASSARKDDDRPALELLGDLAAVELALIVYHCPGHDVRAWPPIEWTESSEVILLPKWQAFVAQNAALLSDRTFANWVALARDSAPLAHKLRRSELKQPRPEDVRAARLLLECALATGLARAGWSLGGQPGAPVVARRGDDALAPFGLAARLADDAEEAERFERLLERHGLAELPLAPAV